MKMNTCAIVAIRDCHILIAFYNVGKISYNWTGVRTVELDTENERFTFVCSSCHQYGKCGNFMLLFCGGQHGLVHKIVLHVQHAYFSSLDQSNF